MTHLIRRLEWRWITPPKLDFWVCWAGLLLPFVLSVWIFAHYWNDFSTSNWIAFLLIAWIVSALLFVVNWVACIFYRNRTRSVVTNSAWNHLNGVLLVATTIYSKIGIIPAVLTSTMALGLLSFFELAFENAIERQSPNGIGEYEALEGPSLGL